MTTTCTAFLGTTRYASGTPTEVAAAMAASDDKTAMFLVFDDQSGCQIEIDTRVSPIAPADEPRGRGRPKLGVVAREVTLLPRHWDWLAAQPGGASVALRKLVDEARKTSGSKDRVRQAQEAAYWFLSAIAGNLAGFEEATRALFAYDRRRFCELIAAWPNDIRDHAVKLAFADAAPEASR